MLIQQKLLLRQKLLDSLLDSESKIISAWRWCIASAILVVVVLFFAGYLLFIDETSTAQSVAISGLLLAISTALTARTLNRVRKTQAFLTVAVFEGINSKNGQ
ncbi:MAG: hypothetical protein V4723_04275 [Pseudomonadota bacterium]